MKKTFIVIVSAVFLLSACGGGNKLDLDEERVQSATAAGAIDEKIIKDNNYEEKDIEVVKVCEAVEEDEEDFGFDGEYLVYWQTEDGEYKREFVMTSDYDTGYGTQRLIDIEDRCISFD